MISGNQRFGIWIFGALSTGNLVQGNFIGTDLTGTANLGNSDDGVLIQQGPVGNTIGGTTTAARNVISGNGGFGVSIGLATSNVVQGNFIGTDVTGAKALGNSRGGVIIQDAASNTIGGATASARNIISGNSATASLLMGQPRQPTWSRAISLAPMSSAPSPWAIRATACESPRAQEQHHRRDGRRGR